MKQLAQTNNKNAYIKAHNRKPLLSFECRSLRFQIDAQSLKDYLQGPIVFVLNQHTNAWAFDFISNFKTALADWLADGQGVNYTCIEVGESQNDLEAKLHKHPFFRQKNPRGLLVISIGDIASTKVARYRAAYGRYDIAQLFCVQGDPEILELVDEGGRLLANTTGVYGVEVRSLEAQIRTLKSLSQCIKSVAILVSNKESDDIAYEQKNQAIRELNKTCRIHGMKTTTVHLAKEMNMREDMQPFAELHQAFIGLRDDLVYGKARELATFCDEKQVVFMASDLPSVMQGAAVGFGAAPKAYVTEMLDLLLQQQKRQVPLHRLGLAALEESPQMHYNLPAIRRQVRDLTQEKDDLLSMLNIHAG